MRVSVCQKTVVFFNGSVMCIWPLMMIDNDDHDDDDDDNDNNGNDDDDD